MRWLFSAPKTNIKGNRYEKIHIFMLKIVVYLELFFFYFIDVQHQAVVGRVMLTVVGACTEGN